jgi:ABC-2 type transport system permease protein
MHSLYYFFIQFKYNLKNAHALARSFWIGVGSMVVNDLSFFVIWLLFMKATGPINGWTSLDVFGMLGVSMFCFGVVHGFLNGIADLPQLVLRGQFDSVLLSPTNSFLKLSGTSFSIVAFGDLLLGALIAVLYGILAHFTLLAWLHFIIAICIGCIVFICVRLLCALTVFYVHDGGVISRQLFEVFLRPGLYPGAVFPSKLKIFFMTIIPTLLTSAVPIDVVKLSSGKLLFFGLCVALVWVGITWFVYMMSIRRYESGNYLR